MGGSEWTDRVEDGVAVVLPDAAVELIVPLLMDTLITAPERGQFGGVVVCLHPELVDGIRRGRNGLVGKSLVRGAVGVVIQAVEQEVVELRALPLTL